MNKFVLPVNRDDPGNPEAQAATEAKLNPAQAAALITRLDDVIKPPRHPHFVSVEMVPGGLPSAEVWDGINALQRRHDEYVAGVNRHFSREAAKDLFVAQQPAVADAIRRGEIPPAIKPRATIEEELRIAGELAKEAGKELAKEALDFCRPIALQFVEAAKIWLRERESAEQKEAEALGMPAQRPAACIAMRQLIAAILAREASYKTDPVHYGTSPRHILFYLEAIQHKKK